MYRQGLLPAEIVFELHTFEVIQEQGCFILLSVSCKAVASSNALIPPSTEQYRVAAGMRRSPARFTLTTTRGLLISSAY